MPHFPVGRLARIVLAAAAVSALASVSTVALVSGIAAILLGTWLHVWPLAFAMTLPVVWLLRPALHSLRRDRVPAVDARPHRGYGELG
ncbi:hypothetical protein [Montanilutibacter psychrotolerans]|uniref:Uncharacterized protein n=1 Tax=Montanilutibacter psychrotolerans TaxID=1327343 RepID=A0A3M8SL54_9GAMM|nr:hypothetical protein [Lysobacter psychrotolerans]RNF82041.1 hypothetical protein EER27_15445 [Lysobacter psychrotolerans]